MKFFSISLGAAVLACNNGPCGQTSFGPSFSQSNFASQGSNSPFLANKPWQGSIPTNWQNSPPSVWTTPQVRTPQVQTPARMPATPRPPNPSLAGRSPSEQLQITKCRSAQNCEKCRQLNCYWDSTARITNRCIALGLESSQIPVEAGQASNLGYCPTSGQQGFIGVNWLAIENSGAAVPNLEGMSDANVQQWLSSIPNYNPDATDANYPAGDAFRELLPTAAKAYADGKIPSTTPWISFFDSLSSLNSGYTYDGYFDSSYTYDLPSADYYESSYGSFGPSFGGSHEYLGSASYSGMASLGSSWDTSYPPVSTSFGAAYPSTPTFSGPVSTIPSSCCGHNSELPFGTQLDTQFSHFPSSLPSFPQPIGSSFSPLGLGALPSPSFGAPLSSPISFGSPLPSQPIGFGAPLSSQPMGFGQSTVGPAWSG